MRVNRLVILVSNKNRKVSNEKNKFRVWDEKERRMLYPDELIAISPIGNEKLNYARLGSNGDYLWDKGILIQYVGLKDNTKWEELTKEEQKKWLINKTKEEWTGKEIYEGDLVKYYGKIYKIVFYRGCFCLESKHGYKPLIDITGEIKVIGNIFENFTLLKEEL